MDPTLKQRIIGVVVITSLAAIFVPMLFDDPIDDSGKMISELEIPAMPDQPFQSELEIPESKSQILELPASKIIKQRIEEEKKFNELDIWIIQLGIFSQKENAIALRDETRNEGFPASIKKIAGKNGDLFQVRVGPEIKKEVAEQLKKQLESLKGIDTILLKGE